MSQNLNPDHLRQWIGKQQTEHDTITAAPLRMMRATLNWPESDTQALTKMPLPALWHWLFFLPSPQQSSLGPDGHAQRGGFLPPVPLPRRMWAAGQFEFFKDLYLGDAITRTSTIDDVSVKTGRSGALCFVRVRHEVSSVQGLALREFHDIVYRPAPDTSAANATEAQSQARFETAPSAQHSETIVPSDTLLFRYSALTFNAHRIHYDRRYVTEVEGYPGLIVHGPLMATLLANKVQALNPQHKLSRFEFRALKPVFDLQPFDVCAAAVERTGENAEQTLWIKDFEGHVNLRARAGWTVQA
jgi:3-methylfumaryl-CoA hydratase